MKWLPFILRKKTLILNTTKAQRELLQCFVLHKAEFESWLLLQPSSKISFRFYYPTAIDFFFGDYKLFTAYFRKTPQHTVELTEIKISEANFESVRCFSWSPFEETILKFLTTMEEGKKVELFEKRKILFEYENLCSKKTATQDAQSEYAVPLSSILAR